MTENKRFTIDKNKIKDNQSPYCYIEYYKGLVPIVDLLNGLAEENNEFKINEEFKNKAYSDLLDNFTQLKKKYQGIKKENKELKQKIESLKMEIAELRESEKDNYNITDGLW